MTFWDDEMKYPIPRDLRSLYSMAVAFGDRGGLSEMIPLIERIAKLEYEKKQAVHKMDKEETCESFGKLI